MVSTTATSDLTGALAHQAAELTFEDLPKSTVAEIKYLVLDALGTMLAATRLGAGCQEVLDLANAQGGAPESTVIGYGNRVSALMAAFANGGFVHALNYDAIGGGHAGTMLPGPLAVAEQVGGVSGKEFITALAAGAELNGRLNRALHEAGVNANEKFLEGTLVGVFGIAAAAGRVMRLTPEQMANAFGAALMQCAGSMQVVASGDPPIKGVYAAFSNHSGLLSALLARHGLGARMEVFEGRCSFFEMYYGGNHAPGVLYENVGQSYMPAVIRYKTWPTGGGAGAWITAGVQLRAENSLEASNIKQATMFIHKDHQVWMEPLDERRHPAQSAAAANGLVFWTAKALTNGSCGLVDLSKEGLSQPEYLEVASRIDYEVIEETQQPRLEVQTASGMTLGADVNPTNNSVDASQHDVIVTKFRDSASWAVNPLDPKTIEELIERVMGLEELDDVAVLPRLASMSRN